MNKDEECRRCGGMDEFIYEINGVAYYYCAGCNVERRVTHEIYGPAERFIDQPGR